MRPGQFVVGSFFAGDGTCANCRNGYSSLDQCSVRDGPSRAPSASLPCAPHRSGLVGHAAGPARVTVVFRIRAGAGTPNSNSIPGLFGLPPRPTSPSGRAALRDRAGGGPYPEPDAAGGPGAAHGPVHAADRGQPRRRRPAAHLTRADRLEPRTLYGARAAAVGTGPGVPRRRLRPGEPRTGLHGRRTASRRPARHPGRTRGQVDRQLPPAAWSFALSHAGDGAKVRARAAGRVRLARRARSAVAAPGP
ncbi:hypothetical protein ACFC08_40150 [Streptomyces sp. NPDC056112]|uniref:hypothetical protein n=1 Tax=unclassified Streptomyces TaxID=2593676 RepID=UPI0035A98E4D